MSDKVSSHLSKNRIKTYVLISLFTAIIAVCSFITVPAVVPFTLQTLGIFTALSVLGGKRGTVCTVLYILLGILGIPVFSGFSAGLGHLLGATGGYIIGFIFLSLTYLIITAVFGNKFTVKAVGLVSGLLVCYLFGTLWYMLVYLKTLNTDAFISTLSVCVLPFIIPDLIKIALALFIDRKIPNTIR